MTSQLDLFRELPVATAPKLEAPPVASRPYNRMDDLLVIIMDDPDQAGCAKYIAENYPEATAAQLLAVIAEAEPEVIRWGCGDLSVLRAELERLHPAWGRA